MLYLMRDLLRVTGSGFCMEEIDKLIRRHQNWSRLSAAFFYSICVAVALNMFWEPGGVFASGVTGLAQLLATIVRKWFNFSIALPFVSLSTTDLFQPGRCFSS